MRYSNDLRERAIDLLLIKKKSIKSVSKTLGIYFETLEKWLEKHKQGTLYDVVKKGGRPRTYDYDELKEFIQKEENQDKTLDEINQELYGGEGSTSGICDALKRLDFRFKKKSGYTKKEINKKEKSLNKKLKS